MRSSIVKAVIVWVLIWIHLTAIAQRNTKYYDGPYISILDNAYDVKWVDRGKKKHKSFPLDIDTVFTHPKLPTVDFGRLEIDADPYERHDSIKKFLAISDIHGQYDLFIDLLQKHAVIDSANQWIYDDGHLVVVGDMFDRGDKVTEILWFLFFLEKAAQKTGGKVHILMGNHELMVLHDNLQYINVKYRYTTGLFKTPYPDLFGEETVLGKWLRSKNVAAVINDIVFVHGGFSKKIIEKENSLSVLNNLFKNEIYDNSKIARDSTNLISQLYFENGPLWYRNYANPQGFDIEQAEYILEKLDVSSIVVGHTSMPRIVSIHDEKIILIDSSIKFGKTGEVLIFENDTLYRGKANGGKISLKDKSETRSPFDYVYDFKDDELKVVLNTDVSKLIRNKLDEEYQPAKLIAIHDEEFNRTWDVRLRARGNMRKKICHLPPLKIDFPKSTLSLLGFSDNDKLKLVLPCDDTKSFQQKLYREYYVYKLYELIDTLAIRTRLARINLNHQAKSKYKLTGFFIEDEENYESRVGCRIIEDAIVTAQGVEREHYLRMAFFQYMIGNVDWALYNKHNLEPIYKEGAAKPVVIPYDFDYAGIVGQDYAVPFGKVPQKKVTDTLFRGKEVTYEEVARMAEFFTSYKESFYDVVNSSMQLDKKSKKYMTTFMDHFYERLDDRDKWNKCFIKSKK